MTMRLPPLRALRAFEAAARHGSIARAAEELCVTPSAISHQLRILEEFLEISLFSRAGNRLVPTEAGAVYRQQIGDAFRQIADSTAGLRRERKPEVLTIHSAVSFGAKWLMPRIGAFLGDHPELCVRVNATTEAVDFSRSNTDLCISYGRPSVPGLTLDPLYVERVMPMCSPALLDGARPLRQPADLAGQTLIHSNNIVTWRMWLETRGVDDVDRLRGLWFDRSHMAIDAAVKGLGVVLESDLLAHDELTSGALVAPFGDTTAREQANTYYLAFPPENKDLAKVCEFCRWLHGAVPAA